MYAALIHTMTEITECVGNDCEGPPLTLQEMEVLGVAHKKVLVLKADTLEELREKIHGKIGK